MTSLSEWRDRAAIGPDIDLEEEETRAALLAALTRLPYEQRWAVRHMVLEDLPLATSATLLQLSRAAVEKHLADGLAALKADRALLAALGLEA